MMAVTYGVRVCLTDGQNIEFKNAEKYVVDKEFRTLEVVVNGYRQIFNMDYVMYAGRTFDLDGENT